MRGGASFPPAVAGPSRPRRNSSRTRRRTRSFIKRLSEWNRGSVSCVNLYKATQDKLFRSEEGLWAVGDSIFG
jgi:hypothetical protein